MRTPWFWCNGIVAQMCPTKYPYAQLAERLKKKKKRKEKKYTQMSISHIISNNNLCLQL